METNSGIDATVRRWQRYAMDVPVLVHTLLVLGGERRGLTFRGTFKDISKQGVAIQVGIDLRVGSELQIEFPPVFEGQPMCVSVVVRNRRGNNIYGLEFTGTTEEELKAQHVLTTILSAMGKPAAGHIQQRARDAEQVPAAEHHDPDLAIESRTEEYRIDFVDVGR